MTEAELLFTALAEFSTRQIVAHDQADGFTENVVSAKAGGGIAGNARKQLEQKTGKKIISSESFLPTKPVRKVKWLGAPSRKMGCVKWWGGVQGEK